MVLAANVVVVVVIVVVVVVVLALVVEVAVSVRGRCCCCWGASGKWVCKKKQMCKGLSQKLKCDTHARRNAKSEYVGGAFMQDNLGTCSEQFE